MDLFPATYFTFATKYPQNGTRLDMARSYTFTIKSDAPDQRIFVLTLPGMQYFTDRYGVVDRFAEPERNIMVLEKFYNDHKTALSFTFDHPVYGFLTCRFNKPLEIPEGIPGGTGVLNPFEVELVEIP